MPGRNSPASFRAPGRPTSSTNRPRPSSKSLMPEDAKEAIGHGVRAKRSKSGAVSFDLLVEEGSHAAVE